MKKLHAFISHANGESELATLLKNHIENDFIGLVDVFVSSDGTSIVVGDKWMDVVISKLREADIYIVLCSQDSVDRPWINIEIGAALSREKRIVPVCHTDLTAEQLKRRPLSDSEGFNASKPLGLRGLYGVLQEALGSRVPNVDFERLAAEIQAFETRYREQKATIGRAAQSPPPADLTERRLPQPRVLCVSSQQFRESIREDLELIEAAFPNESQHKLITNSEDLGRVLVRDHFDIIHVASYVCPITGDLVLNAIDPRTMRDLTEQRDRVTAEVFVDLVRESGSVLVVLANNETLALVTKLLPVTNVVFAVEPVDVKTLIEWLKAFYGLLSDDHTLADSCRKAFSQHQIPMLMYPQLPAAFTAIRR